MLVQEGQKEKTYDNRYEGSSETVLCGVVQKQTGVGEPTLVLGSGVSPEKLTSEHKFGAWRDLNIAPQCLNKTAEKSGHSQAYGHVAIQLKKNRG